jgi:hypothetical protein
LRPFGGRLHGRGALQLSFLFSGARASLSSFFRLCREPGCSFVVRFVCGCPFSFELSKPCVADAPSAAFHHAVR